MKKQTKIKQAQYLILKVVYLFIMKQLIYFLLFISTTSFSQNFEKVDIIVLEYPRFTKVEDLATKIADDFTSDENKARAAFFWIAKNIRYNLKEFYNPKQRSYNFRYSTEEERTQKLQALKDKIITKAFITKTGVCEEYAQIFKKVCDLLGIEAEVIKGNARTNPKEIGKPKRGTNHAWNAVKLNGKWIILDATWAAGYEMNGKWIRNFENYFYNIPKNKIFKTHLPEDSTWVLRFGRISLQEFYNQPIYGKTFLSSKAELISPKKGILKVNSSNEIKLKIKNLDSNSLIYYTFEGQQNAKKPLISIIDKTTTLTIRNAKKNSVLTLYINRRSALHFKTK